MMKKLAAASIIYILDKGLKIQTFRVLQILILEST